MAVTGNFGIMENKMETTIMDYILRVFHSYGSCSKCLSPKGHSVGSLLVYSQWSLLFQDLQSIPRIMSSPVCPWDPEGLLQDPQSQPLNNPQISLKS